MDKLDSDQYARLRPLYAALGDHLSPQAVLAGDMPGLVLVDDRDQPAVALIQCAEGSYLAGAQPPDHIAPERLAPLRDELRAYPHDVYLFVTPPAWEARLAELFGAAPEKIPRRSYALQALAGDWHRHVPPDLELRRLDREFFAHPQLGQHQHITSWAMSNWGTTERFAAEGFGFALLRGAEVLSWCLADCISGGRCEIGIHTAAGQRRQGFATIVVAASVAHALGRGIGIVGWQCAEDNRGSQAVAEKIGFELRSTCAAYRGRVAA